MNDDRRLVEAFRGGDEDAFRELYARHSAAVYRLVCRVVRGDAALAADIVQDAWLRAARTLPAFRWDAAFRTWLTGIALNCCRERARAQARRQEDPLDLDLEAPAVFPAVRLGLEEAIAALPDGYREVLLLHDVEGYTHTEIAALLGISEGTSKSQLSKARRACRRHLR